MRVRVCVCVCLPDRRRGARGEERKKKSFGVSVRGVKTALPGQQPEESKIVTRHGWKCGNLAGFPPDTVFVGSNENARNSSRFEPSSVRPGVTRPRSGEKSGHEKKRDTFFVLVMF